MNILGLIPARAGSQGIPNKNLRSLGGKPILQLVRDAASKSGVLNDLILSTDSAEIAQLGHRLNISVPFLRPPEIARCDTPMIAVIQHALEFVSRHSVRPDAIMLLQPTSPLRRHVHLVEAAKLLEPDQVDSVVSVTPVPPHYSPHFLMKITQEGNLTHFLKEGAAIRRRQDAPTAYSRDGTVYLFRTRTLDKFGDIYGDHCVPLVIPAEDSINLDTMEDWENAEQWFLENGQVS